MPSSGADGEARRAAARSSARRRRRRRSGRVIDAFAAYRCTAAPDCCAGSPLPPIVTMPCDEVGRRPSGSAAAASAAGSATPAPRRTARCGSSPAVDLRETACARPTDGCDRSSDRRLDARGAVNARAVDLLGVEAERRLLRVALPDRQCARQRLGREFVAEAGLVAKRLGAHGGRPRSRVDGGEQ